MELRGTNEKLRYVIAGDKGFCLKPHLLRPYPANKTGGGKSQLKKVSTADSHEPEELARVLSVYHTETFEYTVQVFAVSNCLNIRQLDATASVF